MKHFGKELQKVVRSSDMTVEDIALRAGTTRRNIYKIYEKPSVDIELAVRLSQALQHDFLVNYLLPENLKQLGIVKNRQSFHDSRQN